MVVEQVGPLYVEKVYQWNVDNLGEMRRSNGHNLTLASFLARFLGPQRLLLILRPVTFSSLKSFQTLVSCFAGSRKITSNC